MADEKAIAWKYTYLAAIIFGLFGLVTIAWNGYQLLAKVNEPSSNLVASVEAYPFYIPTLTAAEDFDTTSTRPNHAKAMRGMKKYYLVKVTNTGMQKAEEVRVKVDADNVLAMVRTKADDRETLLIQLKRDNFIPLGTLDIGQQVTIHIWGDTALSEKEEIVVASSKGGVTKPVKSEKRESTIFGMFLQGVTVIVVSIFMGLGFGIKFRQHLTRLIQTFGTRIEKDELRTRRLELKAMGDDDLAALFQRRVGKSVLAADREGMILTLLRMEFPEGAREEMKRELEASSDVQLLELFQMVHGGDTPPTREKLIDAILNKEFPEVKTKNIAALL